MEPDLGLKKFVDPEHPISWEYYLDYCKTGSFTETAKKFGRARTVVSRSVARLKRRAANQGYAPENGFTRDVPEGFYADRVSTYYKATEEKPAQWVIAKNLKDNPLLEALLDAVADVKPVDPVPEVDRDYDRCVTVLPMGDPHVGMYAWKQECGEDFDTDIARRDLYAAIKYLTDSGPNTQHGLLINLGDFFHSDSVKNMTTAGTDVDTDGRWGRVLKVGFMAMRDAIDLSLKKYRYVTVINALGNHDWHTSQMLSVALQALYHNEPRVYIMDSFAHFQYYRYGKCLIGVTHGDKAKVQNLGEIMAADRSEDWGETEHRYWYTGHVHHKSVDEQRGCLVETFRTLAAKDSWHFAQGYRAGRDMNAIHLHPDFGEISRLRCDITRVMDNVKSYADIDSERVGTRTPDFAEHGEEGADGVFARIRNNSSGRGTDFASSSPRGDAL